MKYILTTIFILAIVFCYSQEQENLFKIYKYNKLGYINPQGKIVIEPTFLSAGSFTEGLAPVRINGKYGYINEKGLFKIDPIYDFATNFNNNISIVYLDGSPFYIDTLGNKLFDVNFPYIGQFQNGIAPVQSYSGKIGFIDKKGELFIDTVFTRVQSFIDGLAVVEGLNHQPYSDEENGITKNIEIGVIDTLGKFIIPYGLYSEISDISEGYFTIEIDAEPWDTIDHYTSRTGFVDKSGKLVFSMDSKNNCRIRGQIHCGLAVVFLYQYWLPQKEWLDYDLDKSYNGYINVEGEIVINDTTIDYAQDFNDNRAIVKDKDDNYFIIDTNGNKISKDKFSRIIDYEFNNGVSFVEKNKKYGLIDTTGKYLIKPKFEEIIRLGEKDEYFAFSFWDQDNNDNWDELLYGISKRDGSIIIDPIIKDIYSNGFDSGLLLCNIDDKITYLNKDGKIVWQDTLKESPPISNLNIDFMNRGYFYAYSTKNNEDYYGGWAESSNVPKKINKKSEFPEDILSITVNTQLKDTIFQNYNGISVFVSNNSNDTIYFSAQDSRLKMKVQALNKKGEWQDIEYLPSSWCGNSYHVLKLEPNYYWSFLTPTYEGDFKTKFRIELSYIDMTDSSMYYRDKKEIKIYSNEYEGSVNPAQFWRKEYYFPNRIMDPYFD
ncbi:MAG: WG repeat-containing protein [Bacteroidales bacterium]|nr:WG repeat-containing protein [Bacteroidales bacterium]